MSDDLINLPSLPQWAQNLQHRPNPNRVETLQTVTPGQPAAPRPAGHDLPADPATAHPARPVPTGAALAADPQAVPAEPSYYDIPILKQPVWKWEIATYFYLGGISAGAFLLARMAERFGGDDFQDLAKAGSYLALGALLPCPPLLIHDLGDPKRFHHMLRVWKPTSPMNLGTWAITAYGGAAAVDALRHYLNSRADRLSPDDSGALQKLLNSNALLLANDAAGVPLALMVASYTGVLLSCTSNPLWCKNPWLSPLFVASALSTAAEAASLALDCTQSSADEEESAAQSALRNVDTIAHAVEGAAMVGYTRFAGEKAATLHHGKVRKFHHFSIGVIVAAEVIKRLPAPPHLRKKQRMLTAAMGLAGGFALRWAMVMGGHEAAGDPHTARLVSAPKDPANG